MKNEDNEYHYYYSNKLTNSIMLSSPNDPGTKFHTKQYLSGNVIVIIIIISRYILCQVALIYNNISDTNQSVIV